MAREEDLGGGALDDSRSLDAIRWARPERRTRLLEQCAGLRLVSVRTQLERSAHHQLTRNPYGVGRRARDAVHDGAQAPHVARLGKRGDFALYNQRATGI